MTAQPGLAQILYSCKLTHISKVIMYFIRCYRCDVIAISRNSRFKMFSERYQCVGYEGHHVAQVVDNTKKSDMGHNTIITVDRP